MDTNDNYILYKYVKDYNAELIDDIIDDDDLDRAYDIDFKVEQISNNI